MKREPSSLDIYNGINQKYKFNNVAPTTKDLVKLLEAMKAELMINSNSPLLDISYYESVHFFTNNRIRISNLSIQNYHIYKPNKHNEIPVYAACNFPILLFLYMNNRLELSTLEPLVPSFWNKCKPKDIKANDWVNSFMGIDKLINIQREQMYVSGYKEIKVEIPEEQVVNEAVQQQVDEKVEALMKEAEVKKQAIIDEANQQAIEIINQAHIQAAANTRETFENARRQSEKEAQDTLALAKQQADEIIENASKIAGKKIELAKRRVLMLSADKRYSDYESEHHNTEECFTEVREALIKANESIKLLEDSVYESVTRKAYTQLIELYNLVADTKDSTFNLASQMNDQDLENAAYNMDVFLDMIVEYLSDYGVKTIVSFEGDSFSGKLHTIGKRGMLFDPRNAKIKCSLRNGFIWGEQVLQKEKVEIEGDD